MKRLTLVFALMSMLLLTVSSDGSAFRHRKSIMSNLHECIYTCDIDGEEQTFTFYAKECPDHPDWLDNGPVSSSKGSVSHECVFTYDINGEEQTITINAEVCPEDDGWWDNGPTRDAISEYDSSGNASTYLMKTATTTLTLHKCEYTYMISGVQYIYTACAPQCPDHPDWRDLGIPCP